MPRAARLLLLAILAAAPVTMATRPALAQSKAVQARDHVRAGLAYAERGKWEDALREFEEAYALDPEPLRLYDVAQARLKTRRFRAARDAFAQLLQMLESPAASLDLKDRARAGLASATEHVAKLRVTLEGGKPGDTLTVDGVATATGKAVEIDPGRRVVRVMRNGETIGERTVEVADAAEVAVTIAPTPERRADKVTPPVAPADSASGVPTLALVLGGVALTAGGVGAFFEIRGLNRWSELRDGCGKTKTCVPGEVDTARRNMLVGDIAIGVGVVAAVAAIYVLIARPGEGKRDGAATSRTLAPSPRTQLTPFPLGFTHTF